MTIFQPRLSSISTWTISAEELYKWAEEVLKPKAELAAKGEGEFISGSWCRFCKARNTCRARAESFLELAKMEFQPPVLLSDEEVAEVIEKADELSKWASDVMAYAQAEAIENGKHWNGYKLVEGRSTRRFTDEKKVEEAAKGAGYTDIYNKSLITLTAFEKLMGKDIFNEVLGSYVTKPAGKLTLVPVSDKRPEVTVNTVNVNSRRISIMAKIMNGNRVVTNEVRLSYANVFTPKSINGGDEKYSVSLIIPKSDTETIALINKAIDQAITDGVSKFGGKKPNKAALKLPLRDGIEKDDEAYEDAYFINCNSKTAPQIVDLNRQPITDETEVYSGCYARVSINFYAFNTNGNKGIACGLGNIQKTRDGESLGGGRVSANDDFGDGEDDFLG